MYGAVGTVAAETTEYSPLLTAARNVMRLVRVRLKVVVGRILLLLRGLERPELQLHGRTASSTLAKFVCLLHATQACAYALAATAAL